MMDFKGFTDMFKPMTCVMSVEIFPDGSYGNIRIVTGNDAYINATEEYVKLGASDIFTANFIADWPYARYIPKDLNFEEVCYRCAVKGEQIHTYTHPERFPFWINVTMLPLASDKENIFYCTYTQELTKEADAERMADIAPELAESVLKTCIKLNGSPDFAKTMNDVILTLNELCDAEHCCILITDHNTRKCNVLCEVIKEGSAHTSMNNYLDDNFFDITETWKDTLAGSSGIVVKDPQEWEVLKERNPLWYESLQTAKVKSIVLYPLRSSDEILGYIWALDFDISRTVKIKETLELTSFFISAHIANHQLIRRMEIMSSIDLLTGVFNRNAMNNRIDAIYAHEDGTPQKVGIIFADLNGLKRVNDNDGHFAGDILLKNAAIILQKEFEGCEVYRAGGDEFMIIAPDMDDNEFDECVRSLRKRTAEPDGGVCFAIGTYIDDASNIKQAMSIADARMYEDKESFYKRHPDFAR